MKKYTNARNISLPMSVWLATDHYKYSDEPKTISVTTLMNSPRQIILGSRVTPEEHHEDLSQLIASRVGTAVHDAIEKAWLGDVKDSLKALGYPKRVREKIVVNPVEQTAGSVAVYLEQRVSKELDGFIISGQYDMILDGELHDVKTTKVYSYTSANNDPKYREQLSIYRWLNPELVTKDVGKIQFYFTDWDKHKAGRTAGYPTIPLLEHPVTLTPIPEVERNLRTKLRVLTSYWDSLEEDLPECTQEELWQKPTKYKYYSKHGAKKATKVSESLGEVNAAMAQKGSGYIETVYQEPTKCLYCSGISKCSQAQKYIQAGILRIA